jgi:hypothetical protein
MLEHASGYSPDLAEGRWVIRVRHKRRDWEIIVEPDVGQKLLLVVTAYSVGGLE